MEEDVRLAVYGKQSDKPAKNGWFPGFYIQYCAFCNERYQGCKHGLVCADCAYDETIVRRKFPEDYSNKEIEEINEQITEIIDNKFKNL